MTTTEARKIFDAAAAKAGDADQVARIELVREYCCNPGFRKALEDYTFAASERRQAMVDNVFPR